MSNARPQKTKQSISDFLVYGIGQVAGEIKQLTDDILEMQAHPDRHDYVGHESQLRLAKKLVREKLDYIEQGIKALRLVES